MDIKNNIQRIVQSLPASCRLIAVSKTQPVSRIGEALEAGQLDFGENKVQEMLEKSATLPASIRWHLIGHLQSNKVKNIVPFVHLIHSVDSLKLLKEIQKQAKKIDRVINCLVQVHIAQEETKFGLNESELNEILYSKEIAELDHVNIIGLMGMATFTEDHSIIKAEFSHIHKMFEKLKSSETLPNNVTMQELSIGMSGDYMIAINHGSTMVRVGTAIFGERNLDS